MSMNFRHASPRVAFVLAACAGAAACNVSEEGAEGNVIYTPDECGRLEGCDFADSIAVGGTIEVNIRGAEGVSTAGLDLVSSDIAVLTVTAIPDVGQPTWELTAVAAGVANLLAIDQAENTVDFIEVAVQELSGLRLDNLVGDAVGPTSDETYDEIWSVNAGQDVSFYVTPLVGADPIMGLLQYNVTIDETLENSMLEGADIVGGYYYFNAPAGQYVLNITADNGVPLDVLFDVQ
jgi:hypothetical protein